MGWWEFRKVQPGLFPYFRTLFRLMEKIISFPVSIVAYVLFILCLILFHPIQWICLNVFGYEAHKKSVDYLNLGLLFCTSLLGTRYTFLNREKVPDGVPLIIVANHQSMFDIIAIIWFLRKFHPKFVSKKELGHGIPSVSYNLRHGGSVLIDRKNPKQALPTIRGLSEYIEKHKRSAVIFPEGTRSVDGRPKEFAQTGFKILCKSAPSAWIVPITINNSWKIVKFGAFPMGLGNRLEFKIHEPFAVAGSSIEELFARTEKAIVSAVNP